MISRGERNLPRPTQDRTKTASLTGKLRELFGKVDVALTGKPTPYVAARRKRREETRRGFRMARTLTKKITRSILRYLYLPSPHDPEQERAEAERWLRMGDEWTHGDDYAQEQDGSFHYARASGFDPEP